MATVKTHDLVHCNGLQPIIPSVNESGIYPYNGLIVRFDEDDSRSYNVKKNVQGRFYHVPVASPPSVSSIQGTRVHNVINSITYNGTEFVFGPLELSYDWPEIALTAWPLYTVGYELGYTNNVANGAFATSALIDFGYIPRNLYDFLHQFFIDTNIPVRIAITHPLWWSDEGFIRLANLTFEKHYDADFTINITSTITDNATGDEETLNDEYIFNGETVLHLRNGVDISTLYPGGGQSPQFNDSYSILSYDYDYDTIDELDDCPFPIPFNASLSTTTTDGTTTDGTSCPAMILDCDCEKITFYDTSNYNSWLPGHNPEFFTSRTITITRPDGSQYVYATQDMVDLIDVDVVIPPHYNSTNTFTYNITPADVDGIYSFKLCTYPDWQSDVFYESFIGTIVRRNGVLYKIINSNTNVDPQLSTSSSYWAVYTCDDDCATTRYCAEENMVILCISLLRCYKKLVKDAFCAMKSNPCLKSYCENEEFMNAMKFKIILDSLEYSACAEDWATVEDHVELLKTICCCAS
jgi:hypothetical protein